MVVSTDPVDQDGTPLVEVNWTSFPLQNDSGPFAMIVAIGFGLTTTVKVSDVAEQLNELVSVIV